MVNIQEFKKVSTNGKSAVLKNKNGKNGTNGRARKSLQGTETNIPAKKADPLPSYSAYRVLYILFVFFPIIAGLDKFFGFIADWQTYLAPIVPAFIGIQAGIFIMIAGGIEVAIGIITSVRPRIGASIICFWLIAVIVNLFLIPGFFEAVILVAGLIVSALALVFLSEEFS